MTEGTRVAGGREAPIEMGAEEFRALGHRLVDRISDWMAAMPAGKVTPGETPAMVREALGRGDLPQQGSPAGELLERAADP